MKKTLYVNIILVILLPSFALCQSKTQKDTINYICRRWVVDSIEVIEMNRRFAPPAEIKNNYTDYKINGTFEGEDDGIKVTGKWKYDSENIGIINYDMDNPKLKGEILFSIKEISDKCLAITSLQMSGNQIILRYKPK